MTRRLVGPLAAALVIVGLAVALLAPNHGTAIDPVAQAADTTAAAGTAEFGMSGSVSVAGQSIPLNGSGTIDMRGSAVHMKVSTSIPGAGTVEVEEILSGTTMYMRVPSQISQHLPGGKSWMKLDLQALGKATGVDDKQVMQSTQNNPADILKALKTAGGSQVVGHEDIGGSPTTHYRAAIDLSKAADRIGDKQTVDALKQIYAQAGVGSVPIDAWIDRAGRVRRESLSISASEFSMQLTMQFTRFGVPVDTTPPADDQVMDASSLFAAAAGRSG
jgi:hypothetical protein